MFFRLLREWIVISELIAISIFTAGDGANWVEDTTGRQIDEKWFYLAAFLVLGVTVLIRLVRLQGRIDERKQTREAIQALEPFVLSGNRLLEMYGRPPSSGDDPLRFTIEGLPALNNWFFEITPVFHEHAEDYIATFENDGAIYDSSIKPVSIQKLEGRLVRLGGIIRALQARL